jgi:MoaA/NifB/PqqE/SkfB family radical SAM enzyme
MEAGRIAVVFLTPACDMACPYCGSDAGFRVLGVEEAHALTAAVAAEGFESVVYGGGEPLLWPGALRELCAAGRALGLRVQVGSNLLRLPAEAPTWREVDTWVVPLESDRAEVHDSLRPASISHHARVLAALEAFRCAGAEVTLSSVARVGGAADLDGVARLLRRFRSRGLRLHAWHVYRFQALGRGGAVHAARFAQTDAAWENEARRLKREHADLPILLRPNMLHSKQVAFFWGVTGGIRRQGPGAFSACFKDLSVLV